MSYSQEDKTQVTPASYNVAYDRRLSVRFKVGCN